MDLKQTNVFKRSNYDDCIRFPAVVQNYQNCN